MNNILKASNGDLDLQKEKNNGIGYTIVDTTHSEMQKKILKQRKPQCALKNLQERSGCFTELSQDTLKPLEEMRL